jgi:hypothetical protein
MGVKTYDPTNVVVTLGGFLVTGFAPGKFLEVKQNDGEMRAILGTEGEVARVYNGDPRGTITLTLSQLSDANSVLMGHYRDAQSAEARSQGKGQFPIQVKSLDGTEMHHGALAWVRRPPAFTSGSEAGEREWVIEVADLGTDLGTYDAFGRLKSELTGVFGRFLPTPGAALSGGSNLA